MVPFYIYYSMFGWQRVGDLLWSAADAGARGFLLGATAGLGFTALNARRTLDSDIMFVAMGVLGVFGGLISLGSAWVERKLTPWATRFEAGTGAVQ